MPNLSHFLAQCRQARSCRSIATAYWCSYTSTNPGYWFSSNFSTTASCEAFYSSPTSGHRSPSRCYVTAGHRVHLCRSNTAGCSALSCHTATIEHRTTSHSTSTQTDRVNSARFHVMFLHLCYFASATVSFNILFVHDTLLQADTLPVLLSAILFRAQQAV